MPNVLSFLLVALALPAVACPPPSAEPGAAALLPAGLDPKHAAWTEVLAKHVKGDAFDYAALAKDRAKLDVYVASLEAVKPEELSTWDKKQAMAFWINVYNAYTVKRVVDGYPVKSIRDLGDEKSPVWDRELIPLGRLAPDLRKEKLTLNDVENKILRPKFQDARVHAAINCASKGCPPLRAEAFTSEKLDTQLDEQVKAWLGDPERNRFDKAAGKLEISKVFEWFAEDFQKESGSAQAWIAKFRPQDEDWLDTKKKLAVTYLEYDWALNDAKP